MSNSEDRIGLKSGWFLTVIPYSVSMPMTFGMAMRPLASVRPMVVKAGQPSAKKNPPDRRAVRGGNGGPCDGPPILFLQVLSGVHDLLDAALLFLGFAHERLDVHDAITLPAGDLRPVVGVGGVRQILVLLELLAYRQDH